MRVVLVRHGRETDAIIIADTLIKEQTLDAQRDAVQADLWALLSDDVHHPELVDELQAAVRARNSLVHCSRKRQRNGLLVRSLNQLNHRTLKEADKAACELGPDITMQVHLDVLL